MQVSAARVISIANISPNWLIIMPVFFGFFCGKNDGMFAGFFAGKVVLKRDSRTSGESINTGLN